VFVASGEGTYSGPVVEMTPTFLIQEVGKGTAVLHRLKDLGREDEAELKKGQNVVINKNAGKVMVLADCDRGFWGKNTNMER
jgi:hypothetical protein